MVAQRNRPQPGPGPGAASAQCNGRSTPFEMVSPVARWPRGFEALANSGAGRQACLSVRSNRLIARTAPAPDRRRHRFAAISDTGLLSPRRTPDGPFAAANSRATPWPRAYMSADRLHPYAARAWCAVELETRCMAGLRGAACAGATGKPTAGACAAQGAPGATNGIRSGARSRSNCTVIALVKW